MDIVIKHELTWCPTSLALIIEDYARWSPSDTLILMSTQDHVKMIESTLRSEGTTWKSVVAYLPKIGAFSCAFMPVDVKASTISILTPDELDECVCNVKSDAQFARWLDNSITSHTFKSSGTFADSIALGLRESYNQIMIHLCGVVYAYRHETMKRAKAMYPLG